MGLEILQVDAFTDVPFRGNPAAVCVLPAPRDEAWMQALATEMNLSETAYLLRTDDGFGLRWFTPAAEVDLCGHATLASAHALWEKGLIRADEEARFHTRSGLLTVRRVENGWMEMNFPSDPVKPAEISPELAAAFGAKPVFVGRAKFDLILELASEDEVRGLTPDFGALKKGPTRGYIVTSRASSPGVDFVSRFFAPALGIDEDPATGSAHCTLAGYWAEKLGKRDMMAFQASKRGAVVRVGFRDDRVLLGGQAVTVMRGELMEQTSD